MGEIARSEVSQAKRAFASRDVGLAEDLMRQDREIDQIQSEIFRIVTEVDHDIDTREWAMHMVLVARALERIGDNAVDIGEQTTFVVTGRSASFDAFSLPATDSA